MSEITIISGTLKEIEFKSEYLSSYGFYCYDVRKPIAPPQKQTVVDVSKVSGVNQISKKFESNELVLKGYIETTDYATLKTALDNLAAFLHSDTDEQLIISDEDDRYWNCQYLDSPIIEEKDNYTLVDLIFTCNDPFAYAITPDTDTQAGITTSGETFIIANSGHHYAFPVITITFNQSQSHIYVQNNNISGNRFDISKSFVAGDVLEFDCKASTIKLNGSSSIAGLGDGGQSKAECILLATGNNEMEVGTDDVSLDMDVDMSFNKVYFY